MDDGRSWDVVGSILIDFMMEELVFFIFVVGMLHLFARQRIIFWHCMRDVEGRVQSEVKLVSVWIFV